MSRRAPALALALLAGVLAVPNPSAARGSAVDPGIAGVAFTPTPFGVPGTAHIDIGARFVVILPAADSAVDAMTFRLVPVDGRGPVVVSLAARGCAESFVCAREGRVLSVTVNTSLSGPSRALAYRNPGNYRSVATAAVLGGPVLTGTASRVVKVRKQTGCNLEAVPKQPRKGGTLTMYGRLGGVPEKADVKVTIWFDPAGKGAPIKVRTISFPAKHTWYQFTQPHRGTGTWQARYRGDSRYQACDSDPYKVRTAS